MTREEFIIFAAFVSVGFISALIFIYLLNRFPE